jgi:hypothetical protein
MFMESLYPVPIYIYIYIDKMEINYILSKGNVLVAYKFDEKCFFEPFVAPKTKREKEYIQRINNKLAPGCKL